MLDEDAIPVSSVAKSKYPAIQRLGDALQAKSNLRRVMAAAIVKTEDDRNGEKK